MSYNKHLDLMDQTTNYNHHPTAKPITKVIITTLTFQSIFLTLVIHYLPLHFLHLHANATYILKQHRLSTWSTTTTLNLTSGPDLKSYSLSIYDATIGDIQEWWPCETSHHLTSHQYWEKYYLGWLWCMLRCWLCFKKKLLDLAEIWGFGSVTFFCWL